jgi:hypothetical protein
MRAASQAVPPKIKTTAPPTPASFASVGFWNGNCRRRRVRLFFQSKHAQILSGLPVSPINRIELPRLRLDARALRAAARKFSPRVEGQRAFHFHVRFFGGARRVVCGKTFSSPARRAIHFAGNVVGVSGCRGNFHSAAEFSRIFISLAVGSFRFCRRTAWCSIVGL